MMTYNLLSEFLSSQTAYCRLSEHKCTISLYLEKKEIIIFGVLSIEYKNKYINEIKIIMFFAWFLCNYIAD